MFGAGAEKANREGRRGGEFPKKKKSKIILRKEDFDNVLHDFIGNSIAAC